MVSLYGILQIPRLIVILLQIIGPELRRRLFLIVFQSLVLSAQTTVTFTQLPSVSHGKCDFQSFCALRN